MVTLASEKSLLGVKWLQALESCPAGGRKQLQPALPFQFSNGDDYSQEVIKKALFILNGGLTSIYSFKMLMPLTQAWNLIDNSLFPTAFKSEWLVTLLAFASILFLL